MIIFSLTNYNGILKVILVLPKLTFRLIPASIIRNIQGPIPPPWNSMSNEIKYLAHVFRMLRFHDKADFTMQEPPNRNKSTQFTPKSSAAAWLTPFAGTFVKIRTFVFPYKCEKNTQVIIRNCTCLWIVLSERREVLWVVEGYWQLYLSASYACLKDDACKHLPMNKTLFILTVDYNDISHTFNLHLQIWYLMLHTGVKINTGPHLP